MNLKKLAADYLGLGEHIDVPYSKKLTGGKTINILKYSGLVSVVKRRSSKKISEEWNKNYGKDKNYNPKIPAIISRVTYTAETIASKINLRSKSLVDLGAGDGVLLKILKDKKLLKKLFGVEPSQKNCEQIKKYKIKSYTGTIEEFASSTNKKFDIGTILWTLCACSNPTEIIKSASKVLKSDGYLVIAEGSRILVPYKKPIQMYFGSKQAPDLHPFHFSKNSLVNLLALNKFKTVFINRYIDTDYLVVIAKKVKSVPKRDIKLDDYKKVKSFFKDWYKLSQKYKKEIIT
tara:strand:- start:629 stop:1498 length:870 start_codon:yes stop_codon:yes gene_type:complete